MFFNLQSFGARIHRCDSIGDPAFASQLEFVEREEDSKASDFGVQLMADEKSERTSKSSAKSSGNPSFNVQKTSAQFESNGRRNTNRKFQNGNMIQLELNVSQNLKIVIWLTFLQKVSYVK